MTLQEIRDVILSVDASATHYEAPDGATTYTVWMEYRKSSFALDDAHQGGWKFMLYRVTDIEYDPLVDQLESALDDAEITWNHSVSFNTESKLITHSFDCEAW